MLLFDLGVQVTVGGVWALSAREDLTRPEAAPLESKAFRNGLLYSMLLYVPSAIFFLYAWPGWNSMYLLDIESDRIHGAWYAFADTVALFGCYILGFWLAVRWLRGAGGSPRPVLLRLGAMWAVICVVLFVVLWGRSFAVTSYQQFQDGSWPRFDVRWGEEDSMFGRPLMWWLIVWSILDFGPLAWLYVRARK